MNTPLTSYPAKDRVMEKIVSKICVFRLAFLALLLIPLGLTWTWDQPPQGIFIHLGPPFYTGFIAAGFILNILFLLAWKRVYNVLLFLRIQYITDFVFFSILTVITGGIKSGFVFLLLMMSFLYGRLVGLKTGLTFGLMTVALLMATGIWQYFNPHLWGFEELNFGVLAYTFILQFLALILILILIKMGHGQEEILLHDIDTKNKALQQADFLKSVVFDWMESGLLVLDDEGNISAINRQAANWAEISDPTAAIGEPVKNFYPSLARIWSDYKISPSDRLEVTEKNGEIIYGLRITHRPEFDSWLILFSDITPFRKLENKVREMEKLAVVNKLAAGLAHEMKNPLAGIKASLQLIAGKDLDETSTQRLHQVIIRDIDRLDRLLKDFLNFAKPNTADKRSISVMEKVKECLSLLQAQYPKVHVTISDNLDHLLWIWDPNQFSQVLFNLLINGFQALEETANPRITIFHEENGEESCLIIRDNGPGLPEEDLRKIFDPFFTTKATGSGLGLSVAQRLAMQNNSWIELLPRTGQGTDAIIHYSPSSAPVDL